MRKPAASAVPLRPRSAKVNWNRINRRIVACHRCPRLREHCEQIARVKRRAYQGFDYWGKPVPNFGDPQAAILIVGLAPGAHGANRTGRMFSGDRSGDWLFRALHKAKLANQPQAVDVNDGLTLAHCAITAACHCAPPDNKPTAAELTACKSYLDETIETLKPRVFLALGQIAWKATLKVCRERQWYDGKMPKFAHASELALTNDRWLLASYHPSQQNTFTGRLTEAMLDRVVRKALKRAG